MRLFFHFKLFFSILQYYAVLAQNGEDRVLLAVCPELLYLNIPSYLFCSAGPVRALAIYPLTRRTRGRDVGLFGNPPGILGYVRLATGPDGRPDTSFQFYGRRNSYIRFPNRGRLDTKYSFTLLAWVYPNGVGPIFRYGVDFSVCRSHGLCLRLFPRGSRNVRVRPLKTGRVIRYRKWQYLGATYQQKTGEAMIFVDGRLVARQRLRRIVLGTNVAAMMGAGGGRYFRGRISCMQVYGRALTVRQIIKRKRRCFKGKICSPCRTFIQVHKHFWKELCSFYFIFVSSEGSRQIQLLTGS